MEQLFTLALPLLAMLVSYAIQRGHWPERTNTLIATVTVLVSAGIAAYLSGDLTGNTWTDIAYVVSLGVALQSSAFSPLQGYLKENFIFRTQEMQQTYKRAGSWRRQEGEG